MPFCFVFIEPQLSRMAFPPSPNSRGITSFAGPHRLSPIESHRYKYHTGGTDPGGAVSRIPWFSASGVAACGDSLFSPEPFNLQCCLDQFLTRLAGPTVLHGSPACPDPVGVTRHHSPSPLLLLSPLHLLRPLLPLTPLIATHPKESPITPVLATLPKLLDLKSFICHTCDTPGRCRAFC